MPSNPPSARQPGEERPEHICGLAGYNGMIDPPCPACSVAPPSPPAAREPETTQVNTRESKQNVGKNRGDSVERGEITSEIRSAPADRTAEYAGLLRKATTRLEILRDRMAGCDDETKSDRHELSRWEIDGWIEEQRAALPTEER